MAMLPATARSALAQFNRTETQGSCSRGCTAPDRLHWWGVRIGDEGCRVLGGLVEQRAKSSSREAKDGLSNLLLGRNEIGDACIGLIADLADSGHFRNLKALGLSHNRISDAGCERLAAALSKGSFPHLRDLYLSHQSANLGDRCFTALGSAIAASRGPREIEKISAGDNSGVSVDGLISLLTAMRVSSWGGGYVGAPRLRELSVRNNSNMCPAVEDAKLAKLLAAISGLASTGGRASAQRRRVHLMLKDPACKLAAQDPRWQQARARWISEQHGEVRVSLR